MLLLCTVLCVRAYVLAAINDLRLPYLFFSPRFAVDSS
jgi:hypothetical protein